MADLKAHETRLSHAADAVQIARNNLEAAAEQKSGRSHLVALAGTYVEAVGEFIAAHGEAIAEEARALIKELVGEEPL